MRLSAKSRQDVAGKLIILPKRGRETKQTGLETASRSTAGRMKLVVRNEPTIHGGDALRNVRATAARYQYHPAIKAAGLTRNEWAALFQAMIWQESRFVVNARSHKGAIGLAQLMPGTARMLGVDPNDPVQNLDGGARYLLTQLQNFRSPILALAAYNAGPEAVRKYGGVPPYPETRDYVVRIFSRHEQLMSRY
ncbi:lytic transglycosylase domain-containing protein [Paracoccus alkanivorans]|uniref:Lytic transglycosylase domain-containing protein n=2 Tax=Paracoccus alkanivorans TaxID=2116655 RepID=A0A3M0MHD4_9RHOB|nr:lytic transglycosylase domain-containing protein [Paracoccus alkanivorans]